MAWERDVLEPLDQTFVTGTLDTGPLLVPCLCHDSSGAVVVREVLDPVPRERSCDAVTCSCRGLGSARPSSLAKNQGLIAGLPKSSATRTGNPSVQYTWRKKRASCWSGIGTCQTAQRLHGECSGGEEHPFKHLPHGVTRRCIYYRSSDRSEGKSYQDGPSTLVKAQSVQRLKRSEYFTHTLKRSHRSRILRLDNIVPPPDGGARSSAGCLEEQQGF